MPDMLKPENHTNSRQQYIKTAIVYGIYKKNCQQTMPAGIFLLII